MRVCAGIRAWNGERFLRQAVASIYPLVDSILITAGTKSWGGYGGLVNRVALHDFHIDDPLNKVRILRGEWETEDDQTNAMFDWIRAAGFDWMALVDTDEFYNAKQFSDLRGMASSLPSNITAVGVLHQFYWKTAQYRLDPNYLHANTLFRCTPEMKIGRQRHPGVGETHHATEHMCVCYHLSYVRTDAEIVEKLVSFTHAHEISETWYADVWKAWDANHDLEDLHPVEGPLWKRAVLEEFSADFPEHAKVFV